MENTLLIKLTNKKAINLLHILEELKLLKILKDSGKIEVSEKHRSLLTGKQDDSLKGHAKQIQKNIIPLQSIKKSKTGNAKNASVLENIKAGLEEVRLFKKGKLKTTSAKDFLNEL